MEDWMDGPEVGRKFEAHRCRGDDFRDLEGSHTSFGELRGGPGGSEVVGGKPDGITDNVLRRRKSVSIRVELASFVRLLDGCFEGFVNLLHSVGEAGRGFGWNFDMEGIELRVVSIVGEERRSVGGGMGCVVVGEFGEREPLRPVVL